MRYTSIRYFIRRVVRSLRVRSGYLALRVKYICRLRNPSCLTLTIFPWSELAGLPGSSDHMAVGVGQCVQQSTVTNCLADQVISHDFRIFTDQPLDVSIESTERKKLITKHCHGIDQCVLNSYSPIDWHRDFHSGYRWSPDLLFLDIKVAPLSGADIKVPRELSRFQHVGALAYGDPERSSLEFLLQVTDWIVANPYGRGVNWACSMDIALRAINWIWGLRFFQTSLTKYPDFQGLISNSLRDHGRHVYENLDYYGEEIPTGNHYLADIAGLIYIGAVLPDLPEADLWLAFGIQELISESKREILPDGMCHEASTSYHRLVAELFVSCAALIERIPIKRRHRLLNLNARSHRVQPPLNLLTSVCNLTSDGQMLPASFYSRLEKMAEFSLAMRKPNGLVCQIGDNDSARVHKLVAEKIPDTGDHDHLFSTIGELLGNEVMKVAGVRSQSEGALVCEGVCVVPEAREKAANNSGIQLFPNAGIASQSKGRAWLGVSCGPSGQEGRGGHGHNDKNSFELNVDKFDYVVDGGCPAYTYDPTMRNRFRSTKMHSTIHVAHIEQNVWPSGARGLFMLPEKADPTLVIEYGSIIKGDHHGYGGCHTRRFNLSMNGLIIEDQFIDERERYLVFNLHPKVTITDQIQNNDSLSVQLQHADGAPLLLDVKGGCALEVLSGAFSVGYMRPVENQRLCIKLNAHQVKSTFRW